jgi:hypothetical protein
MPSDLVTDRNASAERVLGWTEAKIHACNAVRPFTLEDKTSGWIQLEMRRSRQDGRASYEHWHLWKSVFAQALAVTVCRLLVVATNGRNTLLATPESWTGGWLKWVAAPCIKNA